MKFLEMFGIGKKKENKYPFFVEVTIYEQVLPVMRGERYEDPLTKFLEQKELGTVSGGGSSLKERAQKGERDIAYINLDLELANLDEAWTIARDKLVELGVPINTEISHTDEEGSKRSESFGELEMLDIFIDNLGLDQEIYEKTDWETLYAQLSNAVKEAGAGEFRADCSWDSETLLYFAGSSADKIFEIIEPLTKNHPVLQNARIVFHRKEKEKKPIELRLPKHI